MFIRAGLSIFREYSAANVAFLEKEAVENPVGNHTANSLKC